MNASKPPAERWRLARAHATTGVHARNMENTRAIYRGLPLHVETMNTEDTQAPPLVKRLV
jgi:hypothetical protein